MWWSISAPPSTATGMPGGGHQDRFVIRNFWNADVGPADLSFGDRRGPFMRNGHERYSIWRDARRTFDHHSFRIPYQSHADYYDVGHPRRPAGYNDQCRWGQRLRHARGPGHERTEVDVRVIFELITNFNALLMSIIDNRLILSISLMTIKLKF